MRKLIQAKLTSCPPFWRALIESGERQLTEATRDQFWGCGLQPEYARHTKPSHYLGKNTLGTILMEFRDQELVRGMDTANEEEWEEEGYNPEWDLANGTPPWLKKWDKTGSDEKRSITHRIENNDMESHKKSEKTSEAETVDCGISQHKTDTDKNCSRQSPVKQNHNNGMLQVQVSEQSSKTTETYSAVVKSRSPHQSYSRQGTRNRTHATGQDHTPITNFMTKKRPANSPPLEDVCRQRQRSDIRQNEQEENEEVVSLR